MIKESYHKDNGVIWNGMTGSILQVQGYIKFIMQITLILPLTYNVDLVQNPLASFQCTNPMKQFNSPVLIFPTVLIPL